MADGPSSYRNLQIALGTMHAKERAIAKPFERLLGSQLVVPRDFDTDAFGTFTGEIERTGTMRDAARAKARLAMTRSGLHVGLASEGSYGPHPYLPFIPGGTELVMFIDAERGLEIIASIVVGRTNYGSHICAAGDDLERTLRRMRFPSHAVTVRPHEARDGQGIPGQSSTRLGSELTVRGFAPLFFKGLQDRKTVFRAVEACASASVDGKALLIPDMRAHLNPTRMGMIRVTATKLAKRIASLCPCCGTPGFGIVDVARGLPCSGCGKPTQLAVAEIHRCTKCGYQKRKPIWRNRDRADPGQCEYCNP